MDLVWTQTSKSPLWWFYTLWKLGRGGCVSFLVNRKSNSVVNVFQELQILSSFLFAHFDQNHSKTSVKRTHDVSFVATASCIVKANKQGAFQCGFHPYVCGIYVSLSLLSVCNVVSHVFHKLMENEEDVKKCWSNQWPLCKQGQHSKVSVMGLSFHFIRRNWTRLWLMGYVFTNRKIPAWSWEAMTKGN